MWIARKLRDDEAVGGARRGRVTIASANPAVYADGELRDVTVLAPAGVTSLPETGAAAVVMPVEGDSALIGCVSGERAKELTLGAGGGEVRLDGDGVVLTFGNSSIALGRSGIVIRCGDTTMSIDGRGIVLGSGDTVMTLDPTGVVIDTDESVLDVDWLMNALFGGN